jgi:hypothetical protein
MANSNDSAIVRVEENGIEYFTVVATGESGMSERGLSRMSGIPRKTISGWLTDLGENKAPKRLESLLGKALYLGENIKKNGRVIKAIRSEIGWRIIREGERLGHLAATQVLDAIGEIGLTSYIQGKTGWLPTHKQASFEMRQLVDRLNEVNPYKQNSCKREDLHYQFFVKEADELIIKRQIQTVFDLLAVSQTQQDFWILMQNRFGEGL